MTTPLGDPLPALWARVLVAFAHDYEATDHVPSLPLWSNLLRIVTPDGIRVADAPRLARVSKRTMGPLLTHGERTGLLVRDRSGGRGQATVRLTDLGSDARDRGLAALTEADAAWDNQFGDDCTRLRSGLEALVGHLDLEHPHFPTGYGPADCTMTGGRVNAPGRDWKPVVRDGADTAAGLPLSALLSQAVVAFAIDYESESEIAFVSGAVFQAIGGEGTRLVDLPPPYGWPGHGFVRIDPVPGRGKIVHLTEAGRAVRDGYRRRTTDIEARWSHRFGADLVGSLRSSAEAITAQLGPVAPHERVVSIVAGLLP